MSRKKSEKERRGEILEAALRCFSKKGYDRTKMEDIVKESGLTKGGIYWYYKSKREIFLALLDSHIVEDILALKDLLARYDSILDILRQAGDVKLIEHQEHRWLIPLIQEMTAEAFRDPDLRKKLYSKIDGSIELFSTMLEAVNKNREVKGIPLRNLATGMVAFAYGLSVFYHLSGKKLPSEEIWRDIRDSIIDHIAEKHVVT